MKGIPTLIDKESETCEIFTVRLPGILLFSYR